jgi:Domain of unknown function (DUF4148)
MNTSKLMLTVASSLAILSTTAMAQEALPDRPMSFKSSLSRDQVLVELQRAQTNGLVPFSEATQWLQGSTSVLNRLQVAAEAREAQALGLTRGQEFTAIATPEQIDRIRNAGLRAVSPQLVSQ